MVNIAEFVMPIGVRVSDPTDGGADQAGGGRDAGEIT
jgi:hypothetical protein